jgi:hypothetical protein
LSTADFIASIALPALAIATLGALAVALVGVLHGLRQPHARGARMALALRLARWVVAALLGASGVWIIIAPRADQPALDLVESAFPAVRTAYDPADRQSATRASRDRARETHRYGIALVFIILGLSLVVSLPRQSRMRRPATPPR